jgi:hypothetical protein
MRLEDLMEGLVGHLKDDFNALDLAISGAMRGQQPQWQQHQQQQLHMQPQQIELEPALREQLERTRDPEEIRRLVTPVINESIIARRFSEATAKWRTDLLPVLDAEAANLEETLRSLPPQLDAAFPDLPKLRAQISQFRSKASTVNFVPPPGEWWRAVETKIQTAHEISIATTRNLDPADFATAAEHLKHLSAAADEAAETAEKHLGADGCTGEVVLRARGTCRRPGETTGLSRARFGFCRAQVSNGLWILVVAAGAWVALASWQLVESGLTASSEAGMWLTVKGLLPVIAGAVYANAVNRRTRVMISKINSQKSV